MERCWKRNVVSRMSSVIVVIRLPISCVSSMAISCQVPAVSVIIIITMQSKLVSGTEHIPSSCLCFPNGSSPLLGETCPQCRRLSCCCSWRGVVGGIISGTSIVVVVEFSLASTAVGRFVFLYVLWVETIRIPRAYGCRPSGGASIRR